MQSDTRIFVFRLRQLLTFLLVLIILIAAAVFILWGGMSALATACVRGQCLVLSVGII